MARKVIDISHGASLRDLLSQTPKNYDEKNYFLRELQEKINAEWKYRPNRVDIEYEKDWGEWTWEPIEVVVQTVKSEKGKAISNDCKNLVFRNINEDRFGIGNRFRFHPRYDLDIKDSLKNTWIVTNFNRSSMTASVIVERCNNTLGSVWKDEQGVAHYHYEPAILSSDLTSTDFSYGEVAVSPGSKMVVTAQYNKYTCNYKPNQRFIIGARYEDPENEGKYIGGQVYRITAINNFYGLSTNDPESVGTIKIYMEVTEASPYDDWNNRIAYQSEHDVKVVITEPEEHPVEDGKTYSIKFVTPDVIPSALTSKKIIFTPLIVASDGTEYPVESANIKTKVQLENWPTNKPVEDQAIFVEFKEIENGNGAFELSRNKIYMRGKLLIDCSIAKEDSPSGEEMSASFSLEMRMPE